MIRRPAAPLFRLRDVFPRRGSGAASALPPGQRPIDSFPRYGKSRRDPPVPEWPRVIVTGLGVESVLDAAALGALPRVELVADFHCVAGWTARELRWEGVRFRDLYELLADASSDTPAGHIRAYGRDGWSADLLMEDALADDVLVAYWLDGAPLPHEHGGPFRLVSASQYGYKSVKHLHRIELRTGEPAEAGLSFGDRMLRRALGVHPRARVRYEERHGTLPNWVVRGISLRVIHPVTYVVGFLGVRRNGEGE